MKIICISDQHGTLPDLPVCDMLIIAGDICPATNHSINYQLRWLDGQFRKWLERVPAKHVVACSGNHDFCFQREPQNIPKNLRWTYLEDSEATIDGIRIHGSPWQKFFHSWAFNAPEVDGEKFLEDKYALIKEGVDIIVTHGPPYGGSEMFPHKADYSIDTSRRPAENLGSKSLLSRMNVVHPKLVVTGHIHSGHGVYPVSLVDSANCTDARYECLIANAAIKNEQYVFAYDPLCFNASLDPKTKSCVGIMEMK